MKFPDYKPINASDLLYFDSWEAQNYLVYLYYISIAGLWVLCTFLTVESYIYSGGWGLGVASLFSCLLLIGGILTIRTCLEGCLSLFVIRNAYSVSKKELKPLNEESGSEEEGESEEESKEISQSEETSRNLQSESNFTYSER